MKNIFKTFSLSIAFSILAFSSLAFTSLFFVVKAENSGSDIIVDTDCQKAIIAQAEGVINESTGQPICNRMCLRSVLYNAPDFNTKNGDFCKFGSNTERGTLDGKAYLPGVNLPIGPSQPDKIIVLARQSIYLLLGGVSLLVVLMGLYGWYLRAMSEGNPEKVEVSLKVYKNAILGSIIILMAGLLAQSVFMAMGISEGFFDFNFIPKYGYIVEVGNLDEGRFCYENQEDKSNLGGSYICTQNRWVKN